MQSKKLLVKTLYVVLPFAFIGFLLMVNGGIFPTSSVAQQAQKIDSATTRFKMDRVRLGGSGLSLSSPTAFSSRAEKSRAHPTVQAINAEMLHSESFRYDNNGVIIDVDFLAYAEDARINLDDIRQQYEKDLARLNQTQKVSYSVNAIERSGIAGIIVDAEYPVQHLQKSHRFEVLTFVLQNQVWRVTAKYKDCDQKGQAMVQWMLESIQIES